MKKLLAERMLDAAAPHEFLSKNGRAHRQARSVAQLKAVMGLSEHRPARSSARIGGWSAPEFALFGYGASCPAARPRRRFGYHRLFNALWREGEPSGINRIHRDQSGRMVYAERNRLAESCVQQRLACPVGGNPTRVKVRAL
ncbi:hypothetical protein ACVIHH_008510 [Bradyrhizobium sp. USDA 4518]